MKPIALNSSYKAALPTLLPMFFAHLFIAFLKDDYSPFASFPPTTTILIPFVAN